MTANSTKVGINYPAFKYQIQSETFSKEQKGPLEPASLPPRRFSHTLQENLARTRSKGKEGVGEGVGFRAGNVDDCRFELSVCE